MGRPKRQFEYDTTTIQIRSDLRRLSEEREWNRRQILEEALLARTTPEDLAYLEAIRAEREISRLDRAKKVLDKQNLAEGARI